MSQIREPEAYRSRLPAGAGYTAFCSLPDRSILAYPFCGTCSSSGGAGTLLKPTHSTCNQKMGIHTGARTVWPPSFKISNLALLNYRLLGSAASPGFYAQQNHGQTTSDLKFRSRSIPKRKAHICTGSGVSFVAWLCFSPHIYQAMTNSESPLCIHESHNFRVR